MNQGFWPDDIRLVLSFSMQFEAGGEAPYSPLGPLHAFDMKPGYPDFPTRSWYRYGFQEGAQRLMDLFDKHKVKFTSHMVGSAVDRTPSLAKEIVERGHEAAAHGRDWVQQYDLQFEDEKKFIEDNVKSIERAAGVRPVGYNGAAMRGTINTLKVLQDLGFKYHIDDVSRDEPFIIPVRGKDFAVVPYSLTLNDIIQHETYNFSSGDFERQLKDEFDQLYEEAAKRRRMMSVSTHDRVAGRPFRVRSLGRFLEYALGHEGVVAMRKDQIAEIALADTATLRDENDAERWEKWESANGEPKIRSVS
ncbi:putative urate catabolism protein [Variovorax sp. PBS-H4]|uniref:polysaccharide deacetylase family protein n=1 Tax=Variovorax sp. PBS-H4 TaxID=434008 RepID=UPI0013195BA3|nr:polysaccharide deacetylase family protein [Variovorax sp. PBS-H4]VTU34301.1 putative urate catabolism protein [Variovorax sp. PBS-H4]